MRFVRTFVISCLALMPQSGTAGAVTVFAAASLGGALDEVIAAWQQDHPTHVQVSYAGSGVLARQISAGAPADVFISAAPDWMDVLEAQGLIAHRDEQIQRVDLLGNALVLIAGPGSPALEPVALDQSLDLVSLLRGGFLAMALPDAVPAGQYGKAALQSLGLWDNVVLYVAQTDNVRAALTLVARGEAPLGITYASDVQAAPSVRSVARFDASLHPPIVYPAALLSDASAEAAELFTFLTSSEAQAVFVEHGFLPAPVPHD